MYILGTRRVYTSALGYDQLYRGRGTTDDLRYLSPALFDYSDRNHTGGLTNDGWIFETEARGMDPFPAHSSLLGGDVRGEGHVFTPPASPPLRGRLRG